MIIKATVYTLVVLLISCIAPAQQVTSFDGISASQLTHKQLDIDPNGAVGSKQYLEWVNLGLQAFDKVTFAPVWSVPQPGALPWQENNMTDCLNITGDGLVLFDRMASRWIVAGHSTGNKLYFCVAISNTDDLTSTTLAWYTYEFYLNPVLGLNSFGHVYFPDWPKIGTWADAYYVSFDLLDADNKYLPVGVVACALDRTNMLTGSTPNKMQCFSDPNPIPTQGSLYLMHSLIPADVESVTPPPAGRDEFFLSIQNPPNDGHTNTSTALNLWDFHVDWVNSANSSLTKSSLSVPAYTPACYNVKFPARTQCVPEPSINQNTGTYYRIDSVGDRLMPRLSYRNFGSYESFLVSHAVQVGANGGRQTGVRWYELRGSGTPTLNQSGTVNPGKYVSRFLPSIAQDMRGNAAAGYSTSGEGSHPGIRASWWNLPKQTLSREITVLTGSGDEENSTQWGDYSSMTVDPVDGCTFWYVNEYFPSNQTGNSINWNTRISKFKISTCK